MEEGCGACAGACSGAFTWSIVGLGNQMLGDDALIYLRVPISTVGCSLMLIYLCPKASPLFHMKNTPCADGARPRRGAAGPRRP